MAQQAIHEIERQGPEGTHLGRRGWRGAEQCPMHSTSFEMVNHGHIRPARSPQRSTLMLRVLVVECWGLGVEVSVEGFRVLRQGTPLPSLSCGRIPKWIHTARPLSFPDVHLQPPPKLLAVQLRLEGLGFGV